MDLIAAATVAVERLPLPDAITLAGVEFLVGRTGRKLARQPDKVPIGRYARRSFLAMDRTPESMFFDNFAAIRLADQRALLTAGDRAAATQEHAYAPSRR